MKSLSKERTKKLCKLKQKKYREESNLALVEGIRVINQLYEDGVNIMEIYFNENDFNRFRDTIAKFPDDKCLTINNDNLLKLSATPSPQSIIALVKTELKKPVRTDKLVYLDGVSEPSNIGTIFRSAAAVGVDALIISPSCCDIFNPKAIRASVGKVFSVPVISAAEFDLKNFKGDIIVAAADGDESIFELDEINVPYVLILGSEAHGVSEEILSLATKKVYIPMKNRLESLNVAMAATLLMYRLYEMEKKQLL